MIKGAVLVSPKFFISFILIIIIICIILLIVQPGANTRKKDKGPELPDNYFNRPKNWGTTEGKSVIVKNGNGKNVPLSGTSICSLYTYENEFDIEVRPSLVTLFQDYYNGLAHQSTTDNTICLDSNQILAYNGEHTCESKIPNTCINSYGNYVGNGVSEIYPVNCRDNLPACPGAIYSISSNFQLNYTGSLAKNSKFIAIDVVEVNDKDYEKLTKDKNYYIDQGYFSKNNGLSAGVYKPIFFNDIYKSSSARQQFKFIRYIYDSDKKEWSIRENGPFAGIIFQPANAYLTADENFNFILKTLEGIDYINEPDTIIQWLMMPALNLNPGTLTSANKFINGNIKDLSNNMNIGTSVQDSGKVYFDPSKVFSPYKDVKINDVVRPVYFFEDLYFSYDGDGNVRGPTQNQINTSYPNVLFQAKKGGEANEQADFNYLGVSAYHYTYDNANNQREEEISLGDIGSIPLKPRKVSRGGTPGAPSSITRSADYIEIVVSGTDKPIGDFEFGNLVFDNQAIWECIDPYDTSSIFDPNYFVKNNNSDSAAQGISFSTSNTVKYVQETKGLVDKIETNNINYNFSEFSVGTKRIILNNKTCNGLINIENDINTNASVTIIFESSQDTNGNAVVAIADILVSESGNGYTNNNTFDIKSTALGLDDSDQDISNLVLVTKDQNVLYNAIPLDNNNNPYSPANDEISSFKNGGLIIPEKDITIDSNGIFKFATDKPIKLDITNGGENYTVGDKIYINQTDEFGNSLLGISFDANNINKDNMEKLASIIINSTTSYPVGISFPSKNSLLRNIPVSSSVNLSASNITYNLNNNSVATYEPSPPQIAYVGNGLVDQLKEVIVEGSSEELSSFFASSKKGAGTGSFTSIEFIKTIQFRELNYIGGFAGKQLEKDTFVPEFIPQCNSLDINAQPVLGRFIPYTKFRPAIYKTELNPTSNGGLFIKEQYPTQLGPNIYFNNNYTQLVPYGLKNIYNQYIGEQNLASI